VNDSLGSSRCPRVLPPVPAGRLWGYTPAFAITTAAFWIAVRIRG
jgi:hypothetical protein